MRFGEFTLEQFQELYDEENPETINGRVIYDWRNFIFLHRSLFESTVLK